MAFTTYNEVLDYLYANLPMYQRVGAAAYKSDLTNTVALCQVLGNPQTKFPTIHVAGTNGKGSTSHMLASILQSAGYKTGLYTSPHLKEFTERIRINGREVEQRFIIDFVNRIKPAIEDIQPSFFEITVAMAFDYFHQHHVDIAVIEVGLGGRLDSTNVITPLVSVVTNIGWDHKDLLGDTLEKIAGEKAGIIKKHVPVVISERQPGIDRVFIEKADQEETQIQFANEIYSAVIEGSHLSVKNRQANVFRVDPFPLPALYQQKNIPGVMACIDEMRKLGWRVEERAVVEGLQHVVAFTGLKGRWQKVGERPLMFCDTGHNVDGIREVLKMINLQRFEKLWMVIGMVKDKDVSDVLALLPKHANYVFCQASIPRALDAEKLMEAASAHGLLGVVVSNVDEAVSYARAQAGKDDFIFIGGSTFVVAEIKEI